MIEIQEQQEYTQEDIIKDFEHLFNEDERSRRYKLVWASKEQAFEIANNYFKDDNTCVSPFYYAVLEGADVKEVESPFDRHNKKNVAESFSRPMPAIDPKPVAIVPDLKIVPSKSRKGNRILDKFMKIDPATLQRKKQEGDQYYMKIERGLIRNPYYMELISVKGVGSVYKHLWANLVRKGKYSDKYDLTEKYFEKGFLAYSTSIKKIAKDCNLSEKSVMSIINVFNRLGIIKTDKAPTESGSKEPQNIYVLGTYKIVKNEKGEDVAEEKFFITSVFLTD